MDPEPARKLSALSPRYPALYDEASGVFFHLGKAEVTEEQALLLAERMFADGIEIGAFDDEGRTINAIPAKKWAKARAGDLEDEPKTEDADGDGGKPDANVQQEPPVVVADKKTRSK